MGKHLVHYGTDITDLGVLMLDVDGRLYWPKRLKFWKWKLHRTMGRPVLVLRKGNML